MTHRDIVKNRFKCVVKWKCFASVKLSKGNRVYSLSVLLLWESRVVKKDTQRTKISIFFSFIELFLSFYYYKEDRRKTKSQ